MKIEGIGGSAAEAGLLSFYTLQILKISWILPRQFPYGKIAL
jgi:hypothetical protein